MKRLFKFLLFFTTLLLWDFDVWAANISDVVINEIAWMGTDVSYNNEWIELYNNGDTAINLDGWTLKADDGAPEINLSGTIYGKGFYLLERTDDETLPGVSADLIYKGALGNDGENLKLYDDSNNIVDQIICSDAWPAGDNTTKQTMERIGSGWQNSQDAGGTPKKENYELRIMNYENNNVGVGFPDPEINKGGETPPLQTLQTKPIEDGPLYVYPKGIVFNEILASPDGPDAENEWIEIYNENDFEVDLSGWQIKDVAGGIKTYNLNAKILAYGYLVFLRPETKITLNNDGDGLTLLNPKEEIMDSIIFEKAPLNQSYAKTSSGWAWTKNLTPGEKNIVSVPIVSTTKPSNQKQTTKLAENENQKSVEVGPQRINLESDTRESSKVYIFLIAFIVALFCSIAFLVVKSNLKAFWY